MGITATLVVSDMWSISIASPPANVSYYKFEYVQLGDLTPTVIATFTDSQYYSSNTSAVMFNVKAASLNMPSGYYYRLKITPYDSDNLALDDPTFSSSSALINYGVIGGGGGNAVCFLGNAPVLTPAGYRRIDSLVAGDMVCTADGRDVAVQRVKHQRVLAPSTSVNPYIIPAGQFGATENLAISPRHCVAVPGSGMVEARELGLRQMSMRAAFDYYNLELPEWDNMVVAGVEVESLAPKKRVVMTAAEFRRLVAAKGIRTEADLAKLAQFVEMLEDGRVAVSMMRNTRRA